jgi:microcystin-dependent protein
MSGAIIGEIRPFAFNFAPSGWAKCDGSILSIASNTSLFAILGTTYGGNGQSTFGLPDLRGRTSLHTGQGPGLAPYVLGEQDGDETVTLLTTEIPSHNHTIDTRNDPNSEAGYKDKPVTGTFVSRFLYHANSSAFAWTKDTTTPVTLHANTLAPAGSGLPHENRQPYLTVNWCVCMRGAFPARN